MDRKRKDNFFLKVMEIKKKYGIAYNMKATFTK